jgi:4-hydroxythreonine-4-phosphate dehydrogenase
MSKKPKLAITMGDPAGIGPEVVLRAFGEPAVLDVADLIVIGSATVMEQARRIVEKAPEVLPVEEVGGAQTDLGVPVLDIPLPEGFAPLPGQIQAECGDAAVKYINTALDLALDGSVDAMVTGPINKAAVLAAGHDFLGHTELLSKRCGADDVAMMLLSPGRGEEPMWLRVTHATVHVPLKDVFSLLTPEAILKTIRITHDALQSMKVKSNRIAVAGLNPHASDQGIMGDEEAIVVTPAIQMAIDQGYDVFGPIPADTVFLRAMQGEFDAVVALYHDQGHIPVKTHGFEQAVNVTLGLPIIRTSVDHGTAFEIAWQGNANETSMVEAIKLATTMAS